MKNWSVFDWVLFMLSVAVAIDLIICIGLPVIFKIPTTEANKEVRAKMLDILNNIAIAIIVILGLRNSNLFKNKDDVK